jgi:hypothetical protein
VCARIRLTRDALSFLHIHSFVSLSLARARSLSLTIPTPTPPPASLSLIPTGMCGTRLMLLQPALLAAAKITIKQQPAGEEKRWTSCTRERDNCRQLCDEVCKRATKSVCASSLHPLLHHHRGPSCSSTARVATELSENWQCAQGGAGDGAS